MAKKYYLIDVLNDIERIRNELEAAVSGLSFNCESLASEIQAAAAALTSFTGSQVEGVRTELQAAAQALTDANLTIQQRQEEALNRIDSATSSLADLINRRHDQTDALINRRADHTDGLITDGFRRLFATIGGVEYPIASVIMLFVSIIGGIVGGFRIKAAFAAITKPLYDSNGAIVMKNGIPVEISEYSSVEYIFIGILGAFFVATAIWLIYQAVLMVIRIVRR